MYFNINFNLIFYYYEILLGQSEILEISFKCGKYKYFIFNFVVSKSLKSLILTFLCYKLFQEFLIVPVIV